MLPYYHDDRLPNPKRARYEDDTSPGYPPNPYTQVMAPNPPVQNPETKLNPTVLQECMENGYKYYCRISLFYPKAVQKSYKVEKRLVLKVIEVIRYIKFQIVLPSARFGIEWWGMGILYPNS